jgi:hypothetical protein
MYARRGLRELRSGPQLGEFAQWTWLDAVSMNNLDRWRDRKAARSEAWEAVRLYVEGGDESARCEPAPKYAISADTPPQKIG